MASSADKTPSVRFTNADRDAIVTRMLAHRFKDDVVGEWPAWAAFAHKVYGALYSPNTRKKMAELPAGWLPESDSMRVRFGGEVTEINFNGHMTQCLARYIQGASVPEPVNFRMQYQHAKTEYSGPIVAVFEATDPICIEYEKLVQNHKTLREKIEQTQSQVRAAVGQFNTSATLLEAWPEIEPFLPEARARRYVAIRRENLNNLLGLPAKEEELA